MKQLLDAEGIQVAQLEARTKTIRGFGEKIERKRFKYQDPLRDVTDLSAVRIILYYVADVTQVGRMIDREFDVDWDNSLRHDTDRDPEHFGYRSDHYVVKVNAQRCKFPEWTRFAGDRIEIQVRTVMQHAWAAVDHQIRYKQDDLPRELQRRLSRLSAVLEEADEQFAGIKAAAEKLAVRYETSVERGELRHVGLDALSLRAYLDQTKVGEDWAEQAVAVGFHPVTMAADHFFGGIEDRTQELLDNLQRAGVTTLRQYVRRLETVAAWGQRALAMVSQQVGSVQQTPVIAIPEHILLILLEIEVADEAFVREAHWRDDIEQAILATIALGPWT